LFYKLSECGDF